MLYFVLYWMGQIARCWRTSIANETLEQLGNALEAAQQKIGAVAEEVSEQAYNELVAIRREKLRGLQEAGNAESP